MVNRTALDPKFKPPRFCKECGGVISDIARGKDGRWMSAPSYDSRLYCSVECGSEGHQPGGYSWLKINHPDWRDPTAPSPEVAILAGGAVDPALDASPEPGGEPGDAVQRHADQDQEQPVGQEDPPGHQEVPDGGGDEDLLNG